MDGDLRVAAGRLVLDESCVWTDEGERIALSGIEVDLLRHLVAHEGEVVTRETLLTDVWGYSPQVTSRAPDSALKRLRRKIDPGDVPENLVTVFGEGVRFLRSSGLPLPVREGPLFGREALVQAIREALVHGDVMLVGPVGIGKTRVALEIAHRHDGPVCWHDADRADPVRPDALVVLDGVDGPGGHRVLRTARSADGPAFGVGPLDPVASRFLFAHHGGPPEVWLEDLGGFPLALLAAARRLQTVSPDALVARLADTPFRVLEGVESAVEATWDAAPGPVRDAWRELAGLAPGFTDRDAERAGVPRSALEALRDCGLLVAHGDRWVQPALFRRFVERFGMLRESASQLAEGSRPEESREESASQLAEGSRAEGFEPALSAARAEARGLREVRASIRDLASVDRLEAGWWALARAEHRAELAGTLVPFLVVLGEPARAVRVGEALLQGPVEPGVRARIRGWLALAYAQTGRRALSTAHARHTGDAGAAFVDALEAASRDPVDPDGLEALLALTLAG
ncbi:MAG: helix-turn-helix domain-containing protein [Myxococcota bacterium]